MIKLLFFAVIWIFNFLAVSIAAASDSKMDQQEETTFIGWSFVVAILIITPSFFFENGITETVAIMILCFLSTKVERETIAFLMTELAFSFLPLIFYFNNNQWKLVPAISFLLILFMIMRFFAIFISRKYDKEDEEDEEQEKKREGVEGLMGDILPLAVILSLIGLLAFSFIKLIVPMFSF